ncbi:hypothetical protein LUZ63_004975 [Rhynchospora breviuscula]|uniref:Uncharacterized protein n=1 Tax=Rhynchospora breviuscula TaxID=2022672 RepID=A0A9Q0HSN3_9POAL|nr:hypothetical protein LUZ63_004975 [Rhynchospora breviuscula]
MDNNDLRIDLHVRIEPPVTLVSPKNPNPVETIYLSNIDQQLIFPVETLFIFKGNKSFNNNEVDIVETVKKALSEKLLVSYFFLAGRINFNILQQRLELVCNNAGILFVGANSDLRLDELGDLSAPNPSFRDLIHELEGFDSLADTPVFTVQVTKFKCGGFSIGYATNHSILDGRSAAEMFQKLAAICRGDETALDNYVLNTDRSYIKARNPLQIKYDHKEYTKQTFSNFSTPTSQTKVNPSLSDSTDAPRFELVTLNSNFISMLKKKAMVKCSSFEAVVAHIWKCRAAAFYDDPTKVSSVLFAVDIRGKMEPPLPDSFVGNAVITASASAVVEDLLVEPFSFCVEMVKEGIQKVTNEYVRSAIDWWEMHKGVPAIIDGNFFVSAWWKLPFHELDFGWGKPVYAGPLVTSMHEFVLLLPGQNGDGINVWIALERDRMERFMSYILMC